MKEYIKKSLKIILSIAMMCFLIHRIDFNEFRELLCYIGLSDIAIVVLVYLLSVIVNAIKWHVLLPNTNLGFLVVQSFKAQLFSTIMPGQLFGEASKVTGWPKDETKTTVISASVVFDKITGIIGQIIIGMAGIFLSTSGVDISNKWVFLVLLCVLVVFLYLSTEKNLAKIIRKRIVYLGRINHKIEEKGLEFYNAWCMFASFKSIMFKSILWGIINQLMGIISIWYLSQRMELAIGFFDLCWIILLTSIMLLLPISFAGIGVRDMSMVSMLSFLGVNAESSLILSMSMLLGQLAAALIGAMCVFGNSLKKK